MDDLLEQAELEPHRADKIRAEIVGLALEYNLVTVYTSFVAIDQVDAVSGGQPRIIHVAQPLPQGLQPGPFTPGVQPMAMMASFMAPSAMLRPASASIHETTRKILSSGRAFLASKKVTERLEENQEMTQEDQQAVLPPAARAVG